MSVQEGGEMKVTTIICGIKCDHKWDGPEKEWREDRCVISTATCSKCGADAFSTDLLEAE